MKIKEYMDTVIKKSNNDDMEELNKIFIEMTIYLKNYHYEMYETIKEKLYVMAYGEVLNCDMANDWVENMKPDGEKWDIEETTSVGIQYGFKYDLFTKNTWYAVMNMMYNDYCVIFNEDTGTYSKLAKAWLEDTDAPDGDKKAYLYYKEVICSKDKG